MAVPKAGGYSGYANAHRHRRVQQIMAGEISYQVGSGDVK